MDKNNFFNFFIEKGLKSPILNSSGIKKFNPDLHQKILEFQNSFYDSDKKFSEMIYCYLKDIKQSPVCKNCKSNKTKFKMFSFGYFDYCSVKCSSKSEEKKEKMKKTCLSKYGVKNVSQLKETKNRVKETVKNKYGSNSYAGSQDFKEKYKKTCLTKYGSEHYFSSELGKEKIKNSFVEKYGSVENKHTSSVLKGLETRREKGQIYKWGKEELQDMVKYRRSVRYYTEKNYKKYKDIINPENFKRGHKKYHLDHVYPILEGWKNKIDPKDISDYRNLKMLKHDENRNKSAKTNIKIEEFYRIIQNNTKLCH
jgi:hypothetical protein